MKKTIESKKGNKKISWPYLLGALVLLVAIYIVVAVNPYIKTVREASSQPIFDMKIGNTIESSYQYLNELGESGRLAYVKFSLLIDMIFPIVYSSIYFFILLFLKQRIKNPQFFLKGLVFFPFLSGLFDILENCSIIILINNFPKQLPKIINILNIMTPLKWAAIIVSMALIFLFIILIMIQNKTNPGKKLMKMQTKNKICIIGLCASLLLITLLIIFTGKNSFLTDIFPRNTLLSANPSRGLIETDHGALYLPKGFSTEKEYPLIVIFHELGGHHTGTLSKFEWLEIADRHQLILFSVKSQLYTWFYDDESLDLKNTKRIVRQLKKELPIKENHTAIYGFSAGAHYVGYLALNNNRFPNKKWFDAFIQISGGSSVELDRYIKKGSIPRQINSSATPGYMVWGEKEVPPPGKDVAPFLKNQGWDITTHPHDSLHFVPDGEINLAIEWFLKKMEE